jgi:hypothetical protein
VQRDLVERAQRGDHDAFALWTDGTQVVSTESALAGRPDPVYVFAVPSHTQPGMAPLPGRFRDCSNPDQLSGTEICEPVGWSPDGTSVFGPELGGDAIVIDRPTAPRRRRRSR